MLRLVSYNICRGGRGRQEPIAAVINALAPDVVVFQEATMPDVVEEIASRCGMAGWGAQRGGSLGFMSRVPVAGFQWHRPRVSRHAFIELALNDAGAPRVFGVHLSAVHAAWTEQRRTHELRALLASIKQHQQGFHVLTGDFNTLAPGELLDVAKLPARLRALVWLSGGKIRWRTIQLVLDAGYADGFRTLHPTDAGLTFPTWSPHVRLDYVFLPRAHASRLRRCEVIAASPVPTASDHMPLLSEIEVGDPAAPVTEGPLDPPEVSP